MIFKPYFRFGVVVCSLFINTISTSQSVDKNYIQSITYKIEATTPINSPNVSQAEMDLVYYDGLGRPQQRILYQQSSNNKDLVISTEYDNMGREIKEFLPYERNSSLDFDENSFLNAQSYYSNPSNGETTSNFWTENVYENSTLNRLQKKGAPGEDWKVIENSDDGHLLRFVYDLNGNEKIHKYKVSIGSSTPLLEYHQKYSENELIKNIVRNEDWQIGDGNLNSVIEYVNQKGQTILKRVFNHESLLAGRPSGSVAYDTYYVYDNYGNLAFVLPPKLSALIPNNGQLSQILLDNLGYQYQYDTRNRLSSKKLPGRKREYMSYDNLDRIIAVWPVLSPFGDNAEGTLHTKYDALNRVAYTCWTLGIENPLLPAPVEFISESRIQGTTTVNGVTFGYSNVVEPKNNFHVLSVSYYDDYEFPHSPENIPNTIGENNEAEVYYNKTRKPIGLQTGQWLRILESSQSANAVLSYFLYDQKGRVVRLENNYPNGGMTQIDTEFNFIDNPKSIRTVHRKTTNSSEHKVVESFLYTSQGKIAAHTHRINNNSAVVLSKNSYNGIGRLIQKKTGDDGLLTNNPLQVIDYKYNIRGWLTDINNVNNLNQPGNPLDLFAFKINYNTVDESVNGAVNPSYIGNISETYWRTATDNFKRKYGYKYDHLNRIRASYYQLPGSTTPFIDSYSTKYAYDRNGNIQSLERKGEQEIPNYALLIDNLEYSYQTNSNKLLNIKDLTDLSFGYHDQHTSSTTPDFEYDDFGNLIKDRDKKINAIVYNHSNLPLKITFDGGETIEYAYLSDGTKFKKTVIANSVTTTTDYVDGFQYTNGILDFFPHAEGYVKYNSNNIANIYSYVFNHTDHLGNIRLRYTRHPRTGDLAILEENHYYPFGLTHSGYNSNHQIFSFEDNIEIDLIPVTPNAADAYRYKYNGKEFQDELGLNVYDYGARIYTPDAPRFWQMDPLAEVMPGWSPYNYTFNNPIIYIDPTGEYPIYFLTRSYAPFKTFGVPRDEFYGDDRGHTLDKGASYRTMVSIMHDTELRTTEAYGGRSRSHNVRGTKDAISETKVDNRTKEGSNFIDVHSFGNNEAQKGSWDIDQFTKITANIEGNIKKDHILHISGTISGDNFPNQESMIYDTNGNTLWLGNFETKKGSALGPTYHLARKNENDVHINIDVRIKVNKDGIFQGVMQGKKMISIEDWNKQFE